MNIDLIVVGKTDSGAVQDIISMYQKRVNFYTKFNIIAMADIKNTKNMSAMSQKKQEWEVLQKQLNPEDYVVLLDEHGQQYRSMELASWLQKRLSSGIRRLVFIIGGPYGFAEQAYKRANDSLSLSKMTFSHQIIRAIFAEQIYRAFTILNNEPYHNE